MNSEKPLTPGEELETRITALLMGELSPDEAATLRSQLAENADLQALHARLSNAFDLLRAAVPLGDTNEQSQPARLSNERRERLLKRFKATSVSKLNIVPIPETKKRWTWLAPLSWAASFILAIGVLAWQLTEPHGGLQASRDLASTDAFSYALPESEAAPANRVAILGRATTASQPPAEQPTTLAFEASPSAPVTAAPAPKKPAGYPTTPSAPVSGDAWDKSISRHVSGSGGGAIDESGLRFDPEVSDYTGMPYYRGRGVEETGKTRFKEKRATPAPAVAWNSQPGAVRSQVRSGAIADSNGPENYSLFGTSPAAVGQPATPDIRTATEGTFWDSKPADKPSEPARPAGGPVTALAANGSISDRERALVAEKEKLSTELAVAKAESKDLKSSLGQMEEAKKQLSMSISDGIDPAKVVELAKQNQKLTDELKEARKGKDTLNREAGDLQVDREKLEEDLAQLKMAMPAAPEGADLSAASVASRNQPLPDLAARGEAAAAAEKPVGGRTILDRNLAGISSDDLRMLEESRMSLGAVEKGDKSGVPATREPSVTTGGVAGATGNPPGSAPQKESAGEKAELADGATRGYAGKAFGGAEIAINNAKFRSGPVGSTKSEPTTGDALVTLDAFDADQDGKELKPALRPMTGTSRENQELLLQADGFADTGRLDYAKQKIDQVLATDPLNAEARELKERIDSKVELYAGSAYNETRSRRILSLDKASAEPTQDFAGGSKAAEDVVSNGRQDWFFKQDGTLAKLGEAVESNTPAQQAAEPVLGVPVQPQTALSKNVDAPAATPRPVAPTPQPEVATRDNAFSTFSLNVSDVAFKLAAASLEQGKMPDPAAIRSEEFINAFDYRDPEPAAGAPFAFATETARYPFAQNRDLLRLSLKTAAVGRQVGRPLNLVLVVDNSGSMERADRVRILRESLRILAAQLQPQDKLSIITFARTPHLWVDGVPGNQATQATQRVGEITPEGGTNLSAALDLAYETAHKYYQVASINRVVLLTDGAANLGNVNPTTLKEKVEVERKKGIALDCFGVGWEGYNDDLLEQLSRNGDGRYGFINSPDAAAMEFASQLAGALRVAASDVKVQVEFNPKRVTAYRQIGYAKHQLTKEQFRDNTVDAAEIGAAESGNALYVLEVNPRGEGDLATVRARFKVPGTSDYREHEWTVPFSPNTPALEQASPALRLAGTASAFSESLAGSPYATEVTSDKLLGIINGVPQTFSTDPRPQKLEWMIRQAKSLSGR